MLHKLKIKQLANVPTLKFPHFTRKIHAKGGNVFNYLFWYFILIIILINLFYPLTHPSDTLKSIKQEIMKNPWKASLHEELGKYYLALNEHSAAIEYALAEEIYQRNDKILGVSTSPLVRFNDLINAKEKIQKERDYWVNIANIFPDYLYAKAKIAVLSYQLGERDKVKKNLDSLLFESPADPIFIKLSEELR